MFGSNVKTAEEKNVEDMRGGETRNTQKKKTYAKIKSRR